MLDSELIEEIESSYSNNEKLNTILNDIKNDANIVYWAKEFATEKYNSNSDLSAEMFEYAQEKAQDFRDYKELAFAVGNSSGFNDKEWAQELLDKTIEKITRLRDLVVLADDLARKNLGYYDRDLARTIYIEAIDKSKTAYDFYEVAESLCNYELLDDKEWSEEIYQKAVEVCANADELTYIADSIAAELGDESWSESLYKLAEDYENGELQDEEETEEDSFNKEEY